MLFPEMTLKLTVSITIVLATMILLIVGLIRLYWRRHKKYAVILAYLRLVHRIPAGYGVFKPKISTLLACALEFLSLTWLKKRLSDMGLFRRGNKVQYTPLRLVNAAIQVCDR